MRIGNNFIGFNISAKGLRLQRKKMNLIAENIANADTVRREDGSPYKRQFLSIKQVDHGQASPIINHNRLKLASSNKRHMQLPPMTNDPFAKDKSLKVDVIEDKKRGEVNFMPEHPDANEDGYVEMSNVNIITEMVEMIAATRSYEANLTALNASKQLAKDSLEI